jgi:hypothetical protein
MLGAMVPLVMHDYLGMYTVAKGQTKSEIIKELLTSFIQEQKMRYPEKELIREISERINILKQKEMKKNHFSLEEFKQWVRQDLVVKGVNDKNIHFILNLV